MNDFTDALFLALRAGSEDPDRSVLEDGGEREAQLRIGDQLDRLRVVEASPAVVGVHFKLDDGLRRRERYRGLVLTPALQWIPSYA